MKTHTLWISLATKYTKYTDGKNTITKWKIRNNEDIDYGQDMSQNTQTGQKQWQNSNKNIWTRHVRKFIDKTRQKEILKKKPNRWRYTLWTRHGTKYRHDRYNDIDTHAMDKYAMKY